MITLPHLVVLIEGSAVDGVREAGEKFLASAKLVEPGAKADVVRGLYRLEYSIQNLAA